MPAAPTLYSVLPLLLCEQRASALLFGENSGLGSAVTAASSRGSAFAGGLIAGGPRFIPAVEPYEDDPRFPEGGAALQVAVQLNSSSHFAASHTRANGNDGSTETTTTTDFFASIHWPTLTSTTMTTLPSAPPTPAPTSAPTPAPAPGHFRFAESWMPVRGPFGQPQWLDRLLVWPEHRFAFCWIDKNAGTQFNLLMNALNGLRGVWWTSSFVNFNDPFQNISKWNGWRFGIFVRDPAERFLSAWSSKCLKYEDDGESCLGRGRSHEEWQRLDQNEAEAVDVFEEIARDDLRPYRLHMERYGYWNAHYDPQSLFCGAKSLDEYDFVGRLTGEPGAVRSQVHEMLSGVAEVPQNHSAWARLDDLFPQAGTHGHKTHSRSRMTKFYKSPFVYNAVSLFYQQDYEQLPFARGRYVQPEES